MNLDSTARTILRYDVEATVAEICEGWSDGEIAELLEDDDDALMWFAEACLEFALESEPEVHEVEIDGVTKTL